MAVEQKQRKGGLAGGAFLGGTTIISFSASQPQKKRLNKYDIGK